VQVRIDNVDDYDARITVLFRGKEIASFNACAYELPLGPVRDRIDCTMYVLDAMPHSITRDTPPDFYA
jgi:hypothetical protein